jgi:hypothetical protein
MEAMRSSETSVHTRSTQRHIPEDGILQRSRKYVEACCFLYKAKDFSAPLRTSTYIEFLHIVFSLEELWVQFLAGFLYSVHDMAENKLFVSNRQQHLSRNVLFCSSQSPCFLMM